MRTVTGRSVGTAALTMPLRDGPPDPFELSLLENPWPVPLGPAALIGPVGQATTLLSTYSGVDSAALHIQVLAVVGALFGRGPYLAHEANRHHPLLYVLLVGESNAGKGTSWNHVRTLAQAIDPEFDTGRLKQGLTSAEGLAAALGYQRPSIGGGDDFADATPTVDKRFVVIETEFGGVLQRMARRENSLGAGVRQLWDDGSLAFMSKRAPVQVRDAHAAIVGHITSEELNRRLDTTDASNGFLNRFLLVAIAPRRKQRSRVTVPPHQLEAVAAQLRSAVDFAARCGEVAMDSAAEEMWFEREAALDDLPAGMLGAALRRAHAQVFRLAVIYAVADCSTVVTVDHLNAAFEVWRYVEASTKLLLGDSLGDPVATKLMAKLRAKEGAYMTTTEIHAALGNHARGDDVGAAIKRLVKAGKVLTKEEKTAGRSRLLCAARM